MGRESKRKKGGPGAWVSLALAVVGMAALSGCGSDSGGDRSGFTPLQFNLTATKTAYAPGEAVPLTLTVKNAGNQPVTLVMSSAQLFDTTATLGLNTVWQKSATMAYATVITTVTYAPGETKTYMDSWNQKDSQGKAAPTGQYSLKYWLTPLTINGVAVSPATAQTTYAAPALLVTVQ